MTTTLADEQNELSRIQALQEGIGEQVTGINALVISAEAAKDEAETAATAATSARDTALVAQAAAESAKDQAVSSATTATSKATAAANSATTASTKATEAAASAAAAADSAAVLEGAAQVGGNNTFTGTNTFNGQLTANGGVSVPEPTSGASPVRQDIAHLYGFVTQNSLVQKGDFALSLKSAEGTGTVTPGGERINVRINDEAATLIVPSYQVIKGSSGVTVAASRRYVGELYEHRYQYSALGGVFLKLGVTGDGNYTVVCAPNTHLGAACKIPLNIETPLFNADTAGVGGFYGGHTWYFEVNVLSNSPDRTIKLRYPDKIDSVQYMVETTSTINSTAAAAGSVTGIFSIVKASNRASVFLAMQFSNGRGVCYFYIGDVYAPSSTWMANTQRAQEFVIAANAGTTVTYYGTSWLPMLDGHWFGNPANILQASMPNTQETTRYTLEELAELYPASMYAGTIEY